jgi:hypothetical protein
MTKLLFDKINRLLIITLSVFITACASNQRAYIDYDNNFDFSQLKSFAWIKGESSEKYTSIESRRMTNAIESTLLRKGFTKSELIADASFLLKTHTITEKKVNVDRFYTTWDYYPIYHPMVYYPNFAGRQFDSTVVVTEYQIGTTILDIVDPIKKQVIWRGSFSNQVRESQFANSEELFNYSKNIAEKLLTSFPPGKRPL